MEDPVSTLYYSERKVKNFYCGYSFILTSIKILDFNRISNFYKYSFRKVKLNHLYLIVLFMGLIVFYVFGETIYSENLKT